MKDQEKNITLLSGGTGTPKLILGLRQFLKDKDFTVIGNTGDDDYFYGLYISPDIDTLIYLFSEKLDLEKFWGIRNDTFTTMSILKEMKDDAWFNLGDKDLAIHLLRNKLLQEGLNLEEITLEICNRLSIEARILPMTTTEIRTVFYTNTKEKLSFQEYTVRNRERDRVTKVEYSGNLDVDMTARIDNALNSSKCIIIGPSNPITSIGPMLALEKFRKAIRKSKIPKIAISPIDSGKAFSGPVVKLLKELNLEPNPVGIANLYKDFLTTIVISKRDIKLKKDIEDLGIKVLATNINLKTKIERRNLAEFILKEIGIKKENKEKV